MDKGIDKINFVHDNEIKSMRKERNGNHTQRRRFALDGGGGNSAAYPAGEGPLSALYGYEEGPSSILGHSDSAVRAVLVAGYHY